MEAGIEKDLGGRVEAGKERGRSGCSQLPAAPTGQMPSDAAALDKLISAQVDKAIQRTLARDDTVTMLGPPGVPMATKPRMYAPTKPRSDRRRQ
jgi:hypothetical protein